VTRYIYIGSRTDHGCAIGGETTYAYDDRGRRISQTDTNGNTTTWGYDKMGREVRHTLPLGMSETYTYNVQGLKATRTDFEGRTTEYAYDVRRWKLLRCIPKDRAIEESIVAGRPDSNVRQAMRQHPMYSEMVSLGRHDEARP
jgi:YD repeat-containing protein